MLSAFFPKESKPVGLLPLFLFFSSLFLFLCVCKALILYPELTRVKKSVYDNCVLCEGNAMKSDGFKNIYFYALLEVEELITSVAII